MNTSKWLSFTKRIPINATIEQVYTAWTTQAELERWFLRTALFKNSTKELFPAGSSIQPGETYAWYWHGYPDSVNECREVIAANGKDELQFMFSGNCLVMVTIHNHEGATICELCQSRILEDVNPETNLYVGFGEGWTFYLTNLKSYLEGGLDLRNKNESVNRVINS